MDERIKVHLKSPRPSLLPGGGEGVDVSLSAHLSIYLNVSISLMGCSDSLTGFFSQAWLPANLPNIHGSPLSHS